MKTSPSISVITVARNAAGTIERTIESFLSQNHGRKELIVIDGASEDATAAISRGYAEPRIRVFSAPDRGMYDALNTGLMHCRGDAVGALNADDAFHDETALSSIAAALQTADAVHGHVNFVAPATGRTVRRWRACARPRSGFRSGWMPAHPTFYVRREVAERVGRFDVSLETAADYDWMLRVIDVHGTRLVTIDKVLVDMHLGGRSTASLRAHIGHNWEALRARRRWLGAGLIDVALFTKPARKLGQFVGVGASA